MTIRPIERTTNGKGPHDAGAASAATTPVDSDEDDPHPRCGRTVGVTACERRAATGGPGEGGGRWTSL